MAPSNEIKQILDEIGERANKALPGPWRFWRDKWDAKKGLWFLVAGEVGKETSVLPSIQAWSDLPERPDAKFIASARTDVPALVKALRRAIEHAALIAAPHGEKHYVKAAVREITAILNQGRKDKKELGEKDAL